MDTTFEGNTNTTGKDEWLTPLEIIKSLGDFDLDPCSPIYRLWDTANNHYTIKDDGLKQDWYGRVWCNPPYGREINVWIKKMRQHGNGYLLIFARTGTRAWHEEIFPYADAIFFFKGRLKFYTADGIQSKNSAGAPSCLIVFGKHNIQVVRDSGLNGHLIVL